MYDKEQLLTFSGLTLHNRNKPTSESNPVEASAKWFIED